jgi:hypothetical protein
MNDADEKFTTAEAGQDATSDMQQQQQQQQLSISKSSNDYNNKYNISNIIKQIYALKYLQRSNQPSQQQQQAQQPQQQSIMSQSSLPSASSSTAMLVNSQDGSIATNTAASAATPTNAGNTKQFWMPDDQVKECFECNEKFTTFRRRHVLYNFFS